MSEAFPHPYDGNLIFLSWGGAASKRVAAQLQPILRARYPHSEVFFSEEDIEVGDDPMAAMFENGLLKAQVLVAVLTKESAPKPWVIWETATVWARGHLVVPVFVDVEPADIPGPLSMKVQGVHLHARTDMDRALRKMGEHVGMPDPEALSDPEWQGLLDSATPESTSRSSGPPALPARFSQRIAPISDGLHSGTLLGIQVVADAQLDDCQALVTSIVAPPGATAMPAPARLYWYPSRQTPIDVAQGATELINLARIGPLPLSAVIESPDQSLPWGLANGAWRIELQITAKGHAARFITAAFSIRPVDGLPDQMIEWNELTED